MTLLILILSLLYMEALAIVYFRQRHIESEEIKIFSILIKMNLFGLVVEIILKLCCFYLSVTNILTTLLTKVYLSYVLWFGIVMTYYVYHICANPKTKEKKSSNQKMTINILLGTFLTLLIFILPIEYVTNYDDYCTGPAVNFLYFCSSLLIIYTLVKMTVNFKQLQTKKCVPLIIFIIGMSIGAVIQKIFPQITITTVVQSFVLFVMYFTIENPDLKIIEKLNIAKEAAEKANHAKSDFLSNMSHEIRTPLNAIVGFSESILEEESLDAAKNDAKDIVMASQNLLEIVNGILDISKIEANKMEIIESEYCLKEHLENLAKLMIPRIGEKPVELKTKFAPDIPDVLYGDIGKIKQIIMNILTNAVKYTDRGMIVFEVGCVNNQDISKLVISVEDTGRGIKPDKIDSIFQKFERLEEDRNTTLEGTGLGLAITKRLVEMMGGKIIVQSKYGEGSKFTVYLKQTIRHTVLPKKEYQVIETFDISGRRVLVVDDNKINLKVATRLLSPFQVTVEECESGEDCIQKIRDGKQYDLILMDDMMPRMSGTETLQELKKDPHFQVPVVVLTANAIEGMKEKYLRNGFDDYLAKPIDKLELKRVLGKYLSHDDSKKEEIFEPLPSELYDMSKPLNTLEK